MSSKVTDKFKEQHELMFRTLFGTNGPGVSVHPGVGISINRPGKRWERPHHSVTDPLVMITGNLPGGGKYNGKIISGNITPDPEAEEDWTETNLELPELGMSLPQDENCYVVNLVENAEASHSLTAAESTRLRYHFGKYRGYWNGLPIVAIWAPGIYDPTEA